MHEGYVARNLEKQGLVADRCELNREIRADNKLLRELKAALQKLTRAAAYSVERIAQALETIRDKIVLAEYQLTVNSRRARGYRNTAESVRPVLAEIRTVGQQILARTAERKTAQTEKDACGLLHPVRLHQLTGQIAALGEEIEELREKKSMAGAAHSDYSDAVCRGKRVAHGQPSVLQRDEIGIGKRKALQQLVCDVLWIIDELFHFAPPFPFQ